MLSLLCSSKLTLSGIPQIEMQSGGFGGGGNGRIGEQTFYSGDFGSNCFSGGFGDFDHGSEVKVVVESLDGGAEAGLTCCF
jgi:hypothetical protein